METQIPTEEVIIEAPKRAACLMTWEVGVSQAFRALSTNKKNVTDKHFAVSLERTQTRLQKQNDLPTNVRKSEAQNHTHFTRQRVVYLATHWAQGQMAPEEVEKMLNLLDGEYDIDWPFILFGKPGITMDRNKALNLAGQIGTRKTMAGLPLTPKSIKRPSATKA